MHVVLGPWPRFSSCFYFFGFNPLCQKDFTVARSLHNMGPKGDAEGALHELHISVGLQEITVCSSFPKGSHKQLIVIS